MSDKGTDLRELGFCFMITSKELFLNWPFRSTLSSWSIIFFCLLPDIQTRTHELLLTIQVKSTPLLYLFLAMIAKQSNNFQILIIFLFTSYWSLSDFYTERKKKINMIVLSEISHYLQLEIYACVFVCL